MGPLVIVEVHEAIEGGLERSRAREVLPAEGDPPMFMQDRLLEPLDEPVRPGMSRLRAGDSHAEGLAAVGEGSPEFLPVIGEHALQAPARRPTRRPHHPAEEGEHPAAVTSPTINWAQANDEATSHPVICQTLPTPFSLPT